MKILWQDVSFPHLQDYMIIFLFWLCISLSLMVIVLSRVVFPLIIHC